jgi:Mn2+/Fe2+ NRAMP family transporter
MSAGAQSERKVRVLVADDEVVVTHEDIDRAHDRARVTAARSGRGVRSWAWLLWLLIGPGILVMLGENDGPSMLSYAATGAKFGVGFFLPFVVLTFGMAVVVQEMTVRLGAATHRGHAELIFERFGPFWGWFSMIDLGIGNFLTLITEFIAIRAGLGFFGVPAWAAVLAALVVLFSALMSHRYWTWERVTLAAAAFNLIFIPVALMAHPHWGAVGHAALTWKPLPAFGNDTLMIILSDIGATVTPWMLFFQQSATVDKGMTIKDIRFGRIDTAIGAALAAAAALGAILATAPLFGRMSAANFEAAQFAQALVPVIGRFGASLFALGMVEAGIVAAITISTSSAYAFGEVARRPHSLNLPVNEGKSFYACCASVRRPQRGLC